MSSGGRSLARTGPARSVARVPTSPGAVPRHCAPRLNPRDESIRIERPARRTQMSDDEPAATRKAEPAWPRAEHSCRATRRPRGPPIDTRSLAIETCASLWPGSWVARTSAKTRIIHVVFGPGGGRVPKDPAGRAASSSEPPLASREPITDVFTRGEIVALARPHACATAHARQGGHRLAERTPPTGGARTRSRTSSRCAPPRSSSSQKVRLRDVARAIGALRARCRASPARSGAPHRLRRPARRRASRATARSSRSPGRWCSTST